MTDNMRCFESEDTALVFDNVRLFIPSSYQEIYHKTNQCIHNKNCYFLLCFYALQKVAYKCL